MIKKILSLVCICVLFASSSIFALTDKEDKWVITIKSPSIERESPDWFTPFSLEEAPEDIDYWKSIIPYDQDKDELMYIVMPTLWLISPVLLVQEWSEHYKAMTTGKDIGSFMNDYLNNGVLHYAGTWLPGDVGNPVIFGHSNFYANKPGRYKSIFADIMDLDVWASDEMRVYTKQTDGNYDLKKFEIEQSYETVPTDVGILKPQWGKELTVFACTNGLAGRWILKGRVIEDNEVLVPYKTKYRVYDILTALNESPEKQDIIVQWMREIERVRETIPKGQSDYNTKLKKYIMNYLERELVILY